MRRLGLDIGTNSIGWCLTDGPGDETDGIVDIGVRIFPDGREPLKSGPVGKPLAEGRRIARGMRRRRDRYIRRRSAFLEALVSYGLIPTDADEAKLIAEKDPYALRAKALDERLEPSEIGRALFHLNQRRGFKSNRKAERKTKDNEKGLIATAARALDVEIKRAGARTLGEFLAHREKKRVRLNSRNQAYDFYPQRDHVLDEFRAVWVAQQKYHPRLLTNDAFAALFRIIEYQRPLKEQAVGKCTFFEDDERLPKAHPLFQERRLYEEVNHLEITTPGAADRKLTLDERNLLILELRDKKIRGFAALARKLKLEPSQSFNKATRIRTELEGNVVYATMANKDLFGKDWANISVDRQWAIVEQLLQEQSPDKLRDFLIEHGLNKTRIDAAEKASRMLPEGYGRLGAKATGLILTELKRYLDNGGRVITYDRAVKLGIGRHHSDERTGDELSELPYYGEILSRHIPPATQKGGDKNEVKWGKITNPTVHIGLRQLQKLVNAIIEVHGRPDQIVVELARELKLNDEERQKHEDRIRSDTAEAIKRSADLRELEQRDTGANRALLKLWRELSPGNFLDHCCPYCGEAISARMLFSNEVQVDHILPYSRTLDDGASNKVVAHRRCNQIKGNLTPYERWADQDPDRWEKITAQVARLDRSKQWRFGPDAMKKFEEDEGFLKRQLVDTQYLSRLAHTYLSSLYLPDEGRRVYVIPGRMTAMLRRLWQLNDVLKDCEIVDNKHSNAPKNRLDHRHHAIDAFVCAMTTQSLLMRIATAARRAEDKNIDRMFEKLPEPWPGYLSELRERLLATTVSHKADHGRKGKPVPGRDVTSGQLHNETAYGLTGDVNCNGDSLVVYRIALTSLQPKDLTDPERMTDHDLQTALREATHGKTGTALQKALLDFSDRPGPWQGIRRVRVRKPLQVIPIRDSSGRAYKGYQGDSNAVYNVWRMPEGKWITHWTDREGIPRSGIISTFDYHQKGFVEHRPHPAAKKVLTLRQNDLVAIERDGAPREIMRVQKYGQNGQIFLIAHNETGKMADRDKNPDDPFKFYGPGAAALQKMKARQVRIDPLGRIFDPGPR